MKNLFGKKGMLLLLVYTYCLSVSMAVATDRSFPAQSYDKKVEYGRMK